MSAEVLTVLETDYQIDASDTFQTETTAVQEKIEDEDWDYYELTNFLSANESELVECPWRPGEEMTLHEITLQWHIYITPIVPENADSVLAELQQLLANKLLKVENELNGESEDDLESDLDTSQTINKSESDPKPAIDTNKQSSDTSVKSKPTSHVTGTEQSALAQHATLLPSAEPTVTNSTYANVAPYSSASTISAPPSLKNNPTKGAWDKVEAQIYSDVPVPNIETTSSDIQLHVAPQETEQVSVAPMTPETTTTAQHDSPTDIPTGSIDETSLDTKVALVVETHTVEVAETESFELSEHTAVDPDDFSHVEHLFVEIADAAEHSEIQTAQKVHEIIRKIIDIPSAVTSEDTVDENQAQKEIVVLFTELLETLGIAHSPELLESLALQTLHGRFGHTLENLDTMDELDESDQTSAVSKVVQQLTVTLAQIRASIDQACAIGKSALMHFGINLVDAGL
jgi:hypothetical protein